MAKRKPTKKNDQPELPLDAAFRGVDWPAQRVRFRPEAAAAENFVRIHRQALVNLAQVKAIERKGEDEVLFTLSAPGAALPASRRALSELRAKFATAGLEGMLP